jgi:hypothetical protein
MAPTALSRLLHWMQKRVNGITRAQHVIIVIGKQKNMSHSLIAVLERECSLRQQYYCHPYALHRTQNMRADVYVVCYKILVKSFLNTTNTQFVKNYPILKEKYYLRQDTASSSVTTMVYKFYKNIGATLYHNGEIKQVPY